MSVERRLKRIALALAVWSFTALVATGQLSLVATVVVYAAYAVLVFRADLYQRINGTAWTVANLFVLFGGAICGYSDLGNTLVYGTVYLQIQKLVRYKSPRDHLWLFLLSFFQVVLSAAISVELSFVLTMGGFLGLAVLALALLTLERGRLDTERRAARSEGVGAPLVLPGAGDAPVPARSAKVSSGDALPRDYTARMAVVSLAVVVVSVFFFLTIPRLAVRKFFMRLRPFDTPVATGFSDQVNLGRLADISTNRAIVMRVWVEQPAGGGVAMPSALRMRGLALDYFDGNRWYLSDRVRRQFEPARSVYSPRRFRVPFADDRARHIHLRVEQYLTQTKWLFGPPFIAELEFDRATELLFFPENHSFQVIGPMRDLISYRVTASLEPPSPTVQAGIAAALASASPEAEDEGEFVQPAWALSERERAFYLQMPPRLPEQDRLRELARTLTQGSRTALERVSRINRFFHEQFRYSVTPEEPEAGQSPHLVSFLFEQREGHCEMFAAATAVLFRLLGLPARVVNGFYTTDFNRFETFFYVRQSHAHTWVEVWLDGFGWLTVDPTPPVALAPRGEGFAFVSMLLDYWDSWTVHWRRHVVDYSLTDQWQFLIRVREMLRPLRGEQWPHRDLPFRHVLHNWMVEARARNQEHGYVLHKVSLAGLLLAWVFYRRQQRRNGHRPAKRGRVNVCPVAFYAELLLALRRQGWRRRPDQTPAEFARAICDAEPDLTDLCGLTEAYYRIRFAGEALRLDEEHRASALLAQLGKLR